MEQKKRVRVLGVTGGVGSGKSTVLEMLREDYGAEIIEADEVARELMEPGGASYRAVVRAFGEDILSPPDSAAARAESRTSDAAGPETAHAALRPIDRGKLAEIVFADAEKLKKLNALTHPLVKTEVLRRIAADRAPLVVYESAIPRQAFLREICDEIWYIHVPEKERIRRLMSSRGYTEEKCRRIMASQMSDAEFREMADRVIENGGSPEETRRQVQAFLRA